MHSDLPPAIDVDALRRLLRLRFARREALLAGLLEAVTGQSDLAAVTASQAPRLQALLECRSDAELEQIARRGDAGQTRISFRCDLLFDGEATPAERDAISRALLGVLNADRWPAACVTLRSVVLSEIIDGAVDRVLEDPS